MDVLINSNKSDNSPLIDTYINTSRRARVRAHSAISGLAYFLQNDGIDANVRALAGTTRLGGVKKTKNY